MSYITVQEAAERWDVSERRVQMFCREGRIPGAFKRNSAWMIPESTQRPDDPRRNTKKRRAKFLPMPLMNTAFTPGCAAEVVKTFKDPRQRDIASAELYYFSGHAEAAAFLSEPYLDETEPALRLSASLIFAYANLALGQIQRARAGLDAVQRIFAELDDDTPDDLRAAAVFVVTTASVLLHLPLPEQLPDLRRSMNVLPAGLRQFAFYVQAHRTYLEGDYARSLGLVEAAFAIDQDDYPIPAIYLHLVAVMNAVSLKDTALAEEHLLAAWRLAQPDDLIEPFGEHHGLLGGTLEAVIKPQWPDDFKRIIDITYRFSAGWRRVHNPETGHDVADNLSTTEFAICMLAARNWSDNEIAKHLGISVHTVKHHLNNAYEKLGIKSRKDLKQYMLL